MIPYFPKQISSKGILFYIVCLSIVSLAFSSFAMDAVWIIMGVLEVSLFFVFSNSLSISWQQLASKNFVKKMFFTALLLRVAWVVFSYFFYLSQTGQPFEFGAADSLGYHGEAEWLASMNWVEVMQYLFGRGGGVSDTGYVFYLQTIYRIFGSNVMVARLLKAVYASFTCVLLYRLASRTFNEQCGRMAGIFAMLMPNLIIYCGLHLKETEMLLLIVAFLERADYTLRSRQFNFQNIALTLLLAGSLFLFRTVLGAVAVFAFASGIVFSPERIVSRSRKVVVAVWVAAAVFIFAGGTIWTEVEGYWNDRDSNQEAKRAGQTMHGNQWAKYATGTVMAPMVFVLPFSTMVDTDQQNQMVLHGGNYVRNFMGIFVLIAFFSALFVKKNWREFSLVGAFVVGYLGVISLSGYVNAERFLLPGLPCLILFWAYGVSILDKKNYRFVNYWYAVVVIMEIAWAYFKIGSRGLLG